MHVGEIGMSKAADEEILAFSLGRNAVVVTLDADFHAILAVSGARGPSVIRMRLPVVLLRLEKLAAIALSPQNRSSGPFAAYSILSLEVTMIAWKRAALLGFASWLIPFVISFFVFPLKRTNAPLFETLMTLIVLVTAGALFQLYFRRRALSVHEALLVGLLWLAVNLVMDYPMFAYGPMKMRVWAYYSEIGLGYLTYPAFGFWASRLARRGGT